VAISVGFDFLPVLFKENANSDVSVDVLTTSASIRFTDVTQGKHDSYVENIPYHGNAQ
jgi:hypothetical protein